MEANSRKINFRLSRAIIRNLFEITGFINQTNALVGLTKDEPAVAENFFRTCYYALNYSRMAHLIKVMDRNSKSATFWYISNCYEMEVRDICEQEKISITELEEFAEKLKDVRDGTHFHIDRNGVKDPALIWKQANLSGDYMNRCAENVRSILSRIHLIHYGLPFMGREIYSGSDVEIILRGAKKEGFDLSRNY